MKNCTEYLELISAYADDELTESDRCRVEEHLSECESCSALLDLYREISAASIESVVPAPDALCSGVMDKILNGSSKEENPESGIRDPELSTELSTGTGFTGAGNAKKNNVIRLVLTRYLPVAACLALVLISLPWVINTNNKSGGGGTDGATQRTMIADLFVESAPDAMPGEAQFESPEAGGGLAGSSDAETRSAGGTDAGGYSEGISEAPAPEPAPSAGPEAFAVEADLDYGETGIESYFTEEPYNDSGARIDPAGGDMPFSPPETRDPLSDFSDAYAWIEVTGPLPELLETYTPMQLGEGYRFEVFYKIPSSVAQELIYEILASQGLTIIVSNRDSDYAIVLYSSEG